MIWCRDWYGSGYAGWNRSYKIGYGIWISAPDTISGGGRGDGWISPSHLLKQKYWTVVEWRVVHRNGDCGNSQHGIKDGNGTSPDDRHGNWEREP